MKKKEVINLSRKVTVRLRPDEYNKLQERFRQTTCHKFSEFTRDILLNKAITVRYRNQTADEFLAEMIVLKNELNAIGNNFNQAVKKLHVLHTNPELFSWLKATEDSRQNLLAKVDSIKEKLNQIYRKWSQE